MEVKASLKYLRISPRKTRLVTELIKGLSVKDAEQQLIHLPKRSSQPVLELLKSAIANAENNFQLNKDDLYVKIARVDEGPSLKRWRPRARGAAYTIKKRTSHIHIVLDEIKGKTLTKKGIDKTEKDKKIIKDQEKEIKGTKEIKESKIKKSQFKKAEKRIEKKASEGAIAKKKVFRRKAI